MCSSSSPVTVGAPAVRISLPPSPSTSEPRNGDALFLGGRLDDADQLMQRIGGRLRAALLDQRVRALEANERDGDGTVLGRSAAGEHVGADRGRQDSAAAVRAPFPAAGCRPSSRRDRAARAAAGRPTALDSPRQSFGTSAAVSALTRISPALAACSIATVRLHAGTGGQHLEVRRADREEMEASRVHALRHLQRDLHARQLIRPTSSSARRIRTAAAQARVAWPSPWNHRSSASPPNLSRLAPFS